MFGQQPTRKHLFLHVVTGARVYANSSWSLVNWRSSRSLFLLANPFLALPTAQSSPSDRQRIVCAVASQSLVVGLIGLAQRRTAFSFQFLFLRWVIELTTKDWPRIRKGRERISAWIDPGPLVVISSQQQLQQHRGRVPELPKGLNYTSYVTRFGLPDSKRERKETVWSWWWCWTVEFYDVVKELFGGTLEDW